MTALPNGQIMERASLTEQNSGASFTLFFFSSVTAVQGGLVEGTRQHEVIGLKTGICSSGAWRFSDKDESSLRFEL